MGSSSSIGHDEELREKPLSSWSLWFLNLLPYHKCWRWWRWRCIWPFIRINIYMFCVNVPTGWLMKRCEERLQGCCHRYASRDSLVTSKTFVDWFLWVTSIYANVFKSKVFYPSRNFEGRKRPVRLVNSHRAQTLAAQGQGISKLSSCSYLSTTTTSSSACHRLQYIYIVWSRKQTTIRLAASEPILMNGEITSR